MKFTVGLFFLWVTLSIHTYEGVRGLPFESLPSSKEKDCKPGTHWEEFQGYGAVTCYCFGPGAVKCSSLDTPFINSIPEVNDLPNETLPRSKRKVLSVHRH